MAVKIVRFILAFSYLIIHRVYKKSTFGELEIAEKNPK